jgi:hypothetical protein
MVAVGGLGTRPRSGLQRLRANGFLFIPASMIVSRTLLHSAYANVGNTQGRSCAVSASSSPSIGNVSFAPAITSQTVCASPHCAALHARALACCSGTPQRRTRRSEERARSLDSDQSRSTDLKIVDEIVCPGESSAHGRGMSGASSPQREKYRRHVTVIHSQFVPLTLL